MLKRTNQLRRGVLTEEGLAKSSKKHHSQNTGKWHLCKAGSFSYGESPWTPPLREIHFTGKTIAWRGTLSLFTTCLQLCVKSPCHWLWHVGYPEKHTKRRETLGNANQNRTTKRAGYKVYEKTPKEALRIKGALWNTGQNKNTNNNS